MICFAFQGTCIALDELLFHRKRLLPRWELIGHPMDTFFFAGFFLALRLGRPEDRASQAITISLGLLSCLIITKDEWVHKRLATAAENWLHAVLFLLHPIVVVLFWFGWRSEQTDFASILQLAQIMTGLFFIYQIVDGGRRWSRIEMRS